MSMIRTRWAALGAAVAVSLGAGGVSLSQAVVTTGAKSVFIPIDPCRLVDTRPSNQIGPKSTPLGPNETITLQVSGDTGECAGIPADATGAAMNMTAVQPTAQSFLTVYPSDGTRPNASNLNWAAGDPPTPNKVDVKLGADGSVKVFNSVGTVHLAADLVGYYIDHRHDDHYYTKAEVDAALPPQVYSHTRSTAAPLPNQGGSHTTINPMFLPSGTYLVTFTATVVNFTAGSDYFRCSLYNTGVLVGGNTVWLGPEAGPVATMTVQAVTTVTASGTAAVGSTCSHDSDLPAGAVYLDPGATSTAMQITSAG
jgi:hypothetical protein